MNIWLFFILFVLVFSFFLEAIVASLNVSALYSTLPKEFSDIYDKDKYRKSQEYAKINARFGLVQSGCTTSVTIVFLLSGGFNSVDLLARNMGYGDIVTGLIFTAILIALSFILALPFSIYSTFVIEERFGFNTTSLSTFIIDILKISFLIATIGSPLLALILWFFLSAGTYAWIYCWTGIFVISLFLQFIAPIAIMPLFNKFSPITDGSLQKIILEYADRENFKLQGIYTMDGSKRSSKLNAFFTGLGNFRKIVFYDTLLKKLSDFEILAILAHEMGHFKLKHIPKMILLSAIQTGLMFYLLSLFILNKDIAAAFSMQHVSVYSSLVFFGFIYSPVSMLTSTVFNAISRKHEYDADKYAATSTSKPELLIRALKKLTVANLGNLTPHPFHVFLHYSHPPVLMRIKKLQQLNCKPITNC
ncbi:MAG: M48 family metallopeptidase [Deltaproteobacteria bacterium]|nr:M48 family metallopeptidase [Deltaproteobacteria bacterium]